MKAIKKQIITPKGTVSLYYTSECGYSTTLYHNGTSVLCCEHGLNRRAAIKHFNNIKRGL